MSQGYIDPPFGRLKQPAVSGTLQMDPLDTLRAISQGLVCRRRRGTGCSFLYLFPWLVRFSPYKDSLCPTVSPRDGLHSPLRKGRGGGGGHEGRGRARERSGAARQ